MNIDRLVLLGVLLLGALTNMGLIVAYASRLNLKGPVSRQLIFVASTGAAEYLTLSLVLLGVRIPAWWFIAGYGAADVVAIRWLILLYWAQRGNLKRKGGIRMSKIAKALASALGAGAAMFYTALLDDVITQTEWYRIIGAVVITGGLTWLVPNAPDTKTAAELETDRIEALRHAG